MRTKRPMLTRTAWARRRRKLAELKARRNDRVRAVTMAAHLPLKTGKR